MAKKIFKPSFLITPRVLYENKDMTMTDRDVYAIVYWFHNLKDGKCYASNVAIAEIVGIHKNTVSASLTKLEKAGYVSRAFDEDGNRETIIPLVDLGDKPTDLGGTPTGYQTLNPQVEGDKPTGLQNNNIEKEYKNSIGSNPIPISGKASTQRLHNFYSLVFSHFFGFVPKTASYAKDASILKRLLKVYSEAQVAMLILLHFEWRGANGNEDFVFKRLSNAGFPISWISPNANAYVAYFKNVLNIDFDDQETILKMVKEKINEYEKNI